MWNLLLLLAGLGLEAIVILGPHDWHWLVREGMSMLGIVCLLVGASGLIGWPKRAA